MLQQRQDGSATSALPCVPCAIAFASVAAPDPKMCLVALA